MKVQKVLISLLLLIMISGFLTCTIDKTPIGFEEDCWNSKTTIRDYDYVKNRYFFVDTFYVNYFEKGWSDDLCCWLYTESRLLREIEVFKSTSYSNQDAIRGLAVLNPQDYDDLTPSDLDTVVAVPGKVEKGDFVRLEENKDYKYDYARGFFWVNSQIQDYEVLAISYKTDLDTIGTFSSEFIDTTKAPVFRLIKSMRMRPSDEEIWPLMMKNVYSLGDSMINRECFNIRIEYNLNGEHETLQQVEPRKSYLYLLGLDRHDKNGSEIDGGDGIVDDNSLLINRAYGILIFPCIQPFAPLPSSRFQIADTTNLYNTTNITDLQNRHKYDFIVTTKVKE